MLKISSSAAREENSMSCITLNYLKICISALTQVLLEYFVLLYTSTLLMENCQQIYSLDTLQIDR